MQSQARIDAYLREFRDRKFSDRNLVQAQRFLLEEKCKYALRVKGRNIAFPQVALACVHPQGYIKSLGGSRPDDLILDNFGTWLTAFLRAPTTAVKQIVSHRHSECRAFAKHL